MDRWQKLGQQSNDLFYTLGQLLGELSAALPLWPLLLVWVAVWLGAVNWKKAWPVLAQGGWVPLVLLVLISALVWSRLAPSGCNCLGLGTVPNFWWQFGAVALLAASALFCGWLQGVFGWTPPEISLEPPAAPAHGQNHHSH